MSRAVMKSIESTDAADLDPAHYSVPDAEDFRCTFGLTVGPDDGEGGEVFYLTVCTPKWLERECEKAGFVSGRHHLIVSNYDLDRITAIITSRAILGRVVPRSRLKTEQDSRLGV